MYVYLKNLQTLTKRSQNLSKKSFHTMIRRNQKRNTYQMETTRRAFPWQKPQTSESQNLLSMISQIKQEQTLKTKFIKRPTRKQFLLEKQSVVYDNSKEDSIEEQNDRFINFEKLDTWRDAQKRIKMEEEQQQEIVYPEFALRFFQAIMKKSQHIKSEFKRRKGLCPQKQFVPQNSHTCQYCGKTFSKPCALGGHISKLHSQVRKKDKELKEPEEWQFVTPVKKNHILAE